MSKALTRVFRLVLAYPVRASVSLLMAVLCTLLVLVLPTVAQTFMTDVIGNRRHDLLIPTAMLGVSAIALRQLLFTLRTYQNSVLEQKLVHDLRSQLYRKLQRLPIRWFDQNSSGEIMSRVASDVPATDRVIVETIDQTVPAVLQLVIIVIWMAVQSWQLTLVTLAPLPLIALISWLHSRRAEPQWRASSEASADLNALLHDNLSGIRQIKSYTVEPEAQHRFEDASRKVGAAYLQVMKGQSVVWPVVSLLAESGIVLMLGCGAWWVLGGRMEAGTPIAFLVAWGFLFDPISRINPLSRLYLGGSVAARRVFEILDLPDEANLDDGNRPSTVNGLLEFDRVGFSYDSGTPAVREISLIARPGQTVALVGPTGAGKSTLLNLLTRFYEADEGEIRLDGMPIGSLSKEWLRDHTGYVTQDNFLFNASLRENLLLAKADASDEELLAALRDASAADFVNALPDGLDTIAGERGVRFSGGEKQRLSIARVLLKNPPLLLLDEATSALDNETERSVQHALERLRDHRTSIVIAHRLSTVRAADLICVMDGGNIVESGKHHELLARSGLYAKLCDGELIDSET